jgi:hypothetical protein
MKRAFHAGTAEKAADFERFRGMHVQRRKCGFARSKHPVERNVLRERMNGLH